MSFLNNSNKEVTNNFSHKILDRLEQLCLAKGLITPAILETYSFALANAHFHMLGKKPDYFVKLSADLKDLNAEDKGHLTKYLALQSKVLNALQSFEKALTLPTPKERFKDFILQAKAEGRPLTTKDLKLRATSTVHPTVFDTLMAIYFERALTHEMEAVAGYLKQNSAIRITDDSLKIIMAQIEKFIDMLKDGAPLTHLKPVMVEEEREVAGGNIKLIAELQNKIIVMCNEGIAELYEERVLNEEEAADLHIDYNPFDNSTWVDVDKDGRPRSDSKSTTEAIHRSAVSKIKLDFRQNAEIHQNLASALIQVAFRNHDDFKAICVHFVKDLNTTAMNGWKDPDRSIYQELGVHKADFLRQLILSDFQLVPQEIIAHAVPFTERYIELFEEFGAEARTENTNMPANITFTQLRDYKDPDGVYLNLQLKFMQKVMDEPIEFNLNGKKTTWHFTVGEIKGEVGIAYNQVGYQGEPKFFINTVKLDAKGNKIKLTPDERNIMMDNLRSLEIIRHAVETYGPNVIADRYEIANFSGRENFYELFLLFKETGLIEIENGLVTKADLNIVPLFETEEDLLNGKEILTKLLEDPLIRSYYEIRGYAELMVGFSDGAKSAGNFASEWAIHKFQRDAAEVFAKHNIPLIIKRGQGSTIDRGGMSESGLINGQIPDAINITGQNHFTTQADEPLGRANSPTEGRDQMAGLLIGTMAGKAAAASRTQEQREMMEVCEEAFEFISRVSASHFRQIIRDNPEAADFLNAVPYNSDASSRAASRGATTKQAYEAMRAVPVSIRSNMAKMPFNNVGLKEALKAFMSGEPVTICEKGEEVTLSSKDILQKLEKYADPTITDSALGMERFKKHPTFRDVQEVSASVLENGAINKNQQMFETLKKHPFFDAFMRKTEITLMANFDPVIATAYGEKTGHREFVQKVIGSLSGLLEITQITLRRISGYRIHSPDESMAKSRSRVNKIVAQGLILSMDPNSRIHKPDERSEAIALREALLVVASGDMRPEPAARMKDLPNRIR